MLPRSPPLPLTQSTSFCLAVDGIDGFKLGTGVAAAEVGQAEVRAEEIRAIAKKFGSVEGCGERIVPLVF